MQREKKMPKIPQTPVLFHEPNHSSKIMRKHTPSFQHEDALAFPYIAGVDEVGYGAWAGPIVVAAAWLNREYIPDYFLAQLDDSKCLGAKKRQEIYDLFLDNPLWGRHAVAKVEIPDIIQGKVLKHTLQAMVRALSDLSAVVSAQVHSEAALYMPGNMSLRGTHGVEEGGTEHFLGTVFGGVIIDGRHGLPIADPMINRSQTQTFNHLPMQRLHTDALLTLPFGLPSDFLPLDISKDKSQSSAGSVAQIDGCTREEILEKEITTIRAPTGPQTGVPIGVPIDWVQKPIPGADGQSYTVALASIMAKVTRDTIMEALSREYPSFGWEKNKGYGTQEHQRAIQDAMHNKNQQGGQHHGLSPHHRPFYCKRACIV